MLHSATLHIVVLALCALNYYAQSLRYGAEYGAIYALVMFVALWTIQFLFNAVYLYSRKNKSILTTHTVNLQDDAFVQETKFNKSYYYWPGLVKVKDWPGYVPVYTTPHTAHIVPKRAFRSVDERRRFVALVKEKILNAAKAA